MTTCKRLTCSRPARDKDVGLCRAHYNQFLRSRAERGGYTLGLVEVTAVAEHIAELREVGLGINRIAELSGVDSRSIARALKSGRMRGFSAKKILDVPVDWRLASPAAKIPRTGTMRRLQSLAAIGYSYRRIGEHLGGVDAKNICKYALGRQGVTAAFARRVEDVFHELQLRPLPRDSSSTQARARALEKGWAPPLAWDEEAIDDPLAKPAAAWAGKPTRASDADIVHLRSLGFSSREIAGELGVELESLERRFARRAA